MPKDHYIELVGKIVLLIDVMRNEPEGISLQELVLRTGYVKSSIHRILQSLKRHGYVEQDTAGGPYRLGVQFLVVAGGIKQGINLVQVARPYLRELVATFDESAYLAVLRAGRGFFVDVQETARDLRLVGSLANEVHFHATAAGKAMGAFLPTDWRAALLQNSKPRRLTPRTLVDPGQIEREWARVRRLGWAINDEETIVGAVFLAAPLFDSRNQVCGSASLGIPKPRYSAELGKRIRSHLVDGCRRLSDRLAAAGYVHQAGSYDSAL